MNILSIVHIPKDGINDFFAFYKQLYNDSNSKQKYLIRLPDPEAKWGGTNPTLEMIDDKEWYKIKLSHLSDYPCVRVTLEAVLSLLRAIKNTESKLETVYEMRVTIPSRRTPKHQVLESFHYIPDKEPVIETTYHDKTYTIGYRMELPSHLLEKFYESHTLAPQFYPVEFTAETLTVEYTCNQHPSVGRIMQQILLALLDETPNTPVILTIFLEDRTILDNRIYEYINGFLNFISSYTYVPSLDVPIKLI
ncbi:MAG: hypothetical protein ATN33_08080 [Epulopiscium sp. Nele67-Bin001]|nr:MAG: hypothetical protein BEN18_07900 [Epulopiscium sp. Nuni2H_MBin001]OON92041.1 MAG: hypothetical protein ATN33_08080 [Epulopiscium sp. Nele67-Bin001]